MPALRSRFSPAGPMVSTWKFWSASSCLTSVRSAYWLAGTSFPHTWEASRISVILYVNIDGPLRFAGDQEPGAVAGIDHLGAEVPVHVGFAAQAGQRRLHAH